MISTMPNMPITSGQEVDAVPQLRDAERVAREAAVDVGADQAEQQADQHHADRLDHRAVRQDHRRDEAEHHQREIVGRVELLARSAASGGPNAAMKTVPTQPAKNEPSAATPSAAPARPCLRHLVAVDAGDDRAGLARHVDQDRRGRAAVLRAVVDAGQHDQRRQRIEPEGDRQQHGDGRDRADAGQHADQRAEQAADAARSRDSSSDTAAPKPVARFWNRSNSILPAPPGRQRLAERVDEHHDGEQPRAPRRAAMRLAELHVAAAHRRRRPSAATAVIASPTISIRKPKIRMAATMNAIGPQLHRLDRRSFDGQRP